MQNSCCDHRNFDSVNQLDTEPADWRSFTAKKPTSCSGLLKTHWTMLCCPHCSMLSTILFSIVAPECELTQAQQCWTTLLTILNNVGSQRLFNSGCGCFQRSWTGCSLSDFSPFLKITHSGYKDYANREATFFFCLKLVSSTWFQPSLLRRGYLWSINKINYTWMADKV